MHQTGQTWRNRLTGVEVLNPPDDQALGFWCLSDGSHWCGLDSNGTGIPEALLPKVHLENAVISISKVIDGLDVRAWGDWCNMLPVDSSLSDSLDEKPEESALGSAMPHLEEICRNPRAHLTVCELREPVSRARRIPPRAIALLSAHSEDWHSRTFRSVRPKAVLSEVTEDEWAIYENRALRTLRTQVLESFTPRLLTLRELLSAMDRSSDGDAFGYRFRINRLCILLSELLRNQQDRDQLRALVTRLTSIHKSLLGLGGTFLLKTIRQSPLVSSPLRPTNILRDDKRYRKIFQLWHLWERRDEEKVTRAERLGRLSTAMDRYTAILCGRAFTMLQMVCEDETKQSSAQLFEQGAKPVKLKRGWSFVWSEDGSFALLRPDGHVAIRIVAIAAQIDRLSVCTVAEVASTVASSENAGPSVLILSLGQPDGSPATWPQYLVEWRQAQRHALTELPKCLLLEVSPSQLDPVEHVARVLRRVIAEVEWPELPLKISLPQGFASASRDLPHAVSDSFTQSPSASLVAKLGQLESFTGETVTKLEESLSKIIDQIERIGITSQTKELAKEKALLESELKTNKVKFTIWKELLREVKRLERIFAPVLICPSCGWITTNAPQASMFSCSSDSCNTRWGRRPDATGIMHVFLMPNGEDPSNPPHGQDPLDRYGADFI